MSKSRFRFLGNRAVACLFLVCAGAFAACEDEVSPGPVPVDIEIVSGNGQYSKQGTELQNPIVVQVTDSDGQPGIGVPVRFAIRSGGGTLSRTTANTNSEGESNVRWTLGPGLGTQELTIELADDGEVETVAQATSATFHCPEEDPVFARQFTPATDLFLFTHASSVTVSGGTARAGVVHLGLDLMNTEFDAEQIVAFDWQFIQAVVRDCAFAQSGEFYIAWTSTSSVREIAKIASNRVVTHFATLEGILGTEITWIENGVLGGCDEFGPFTVGCRDTLTRYDDAVFSGTAPHIANYDAVAYDAAGNFLYFIDVPNRRLKRIPLDGYTQTGDIQEVVTLEPDETNGAVGMVVHTDGSVFMVVETDATKSIVKVTSAGVKTTEFDFFSRGAGNAAGIQDDLAIDSLPTRNFLYTLDTLNNVILLYRFTDGFFVELSPDGFTDPNAASNTSSRERVGLAVLP